MYLFTCSKLLPLHELIKVQADRYACMILANRECTCIYSGPCDLRSLHFTIPSTLRPAIGDTILIFSMQIFLYFKTTSNLRPNFYG